MSFDFDSTEFHGVLVADTLRNERYRQSIFETVKKGDTVVDIGAGSGVLSFFACQAGAKRVYAIERTKIIEIAKAIAEANGLVDQVVFINQDSRKIELPTKADVIISELISKFGVGQNLVDVISDAQRRFLKPGGKSLPSWLEMTIVPIQDADFYNTIDVWSSDFYNLDFSLARETALNEVYSNRFNKTNFLSAPAQLHTIDFANMPEHSMLNERVTFQIENDGVLHGFCGWFNAQLSENTWLTNEPPSPVLSWDNIFFPILKPCTVRAGDLIDLQIRSFPATLNCVWKWTVDIHPSWNTKRRRYVHSTLQQWGGELQRALEINQQDAI